MTRVNEQGLKRGFFAGTTTELHKATDLLHDPNTDDPYKQLSSSASFRSRIDLASLCEDQRRNTNVGPTLVEAYRFTIAGQRLRQSEVVSPKIIV